MDFSTISRDQLIDKIKLLIGNKEFEKAEILIGKALTESKRLPFLYLHLAQIYNSTGRCDDAIRLLKDAIELWPEVKSIRNRAATFLNQKGAYSQALAVLEPISDPDLNPSIVRNRVTSLFNLGQLDAAYDVIRQMKVPWPSVLLVFLAKFVFKTGLAQGVESAQQLTNDIEQNILDKQKFHKFLQRELIRETRGLVLDHESRTIVPLAKYILSHTKQLELQHVVPLAEFYLSMGEYKQVANLLLHYPDLGTKELKRKREWLLLLSSTVVDNSTLPGDTNLRADEVLLENSLYHFKNGTRRCFIWFAGVVLANSMVALEALLPILKARRISCLVVTDKKRYMSLGGFGPFFPDRFRAAEALSEILKLKGYQDLATSACSGSGLSALLYGMELGAKGILGLNALTRMPEDIPGMNPLALKHRNKIFKTVTVTPSDGYELVKENPNTNVFLSFSEDFSFDYDNAHHLADLPNVNLWPEKHNSHDLLQWLNNNDQLQNTFEKFLDRIDWGKSPRLASGS